MAHLAAALGKSNTTNIAAQTFIPPIIVHNVRINDSENFPINISPNQVFETEIQNETIVLPIVSKTTNMPPAGALVYETEIEAQPTTFTDDSSSSDMSLNQQSIFVSIESSATDMLPNDAQVLETSIQSQPITLTDDLSTVELPIIDAALFESGIQNRPALIPIELPSAVTNNYSDIVLLAMEGLEDADFLNIGNLDFPEGVEMVLTDECRSEENVASTSGQNMTKTIVIDVPFNGSEILNVRNTFDSVTDNSPSASTSLPKQHNCGKENTFPVQENQNLSVGEIDYKKTYLKLKEQNLSLGDRNLALQNALVAADKALGKIPQVQFTKKDGGRLYAEGVFLNAEQCKVLDATRDDSKFVNNLVVSVFGRDTFKISSVTGMESKNHQAPAKPGLNPLWLQLVYDLTDAKTNKRLNKAEINKIVNKKISNLNGAEKRKLLKQKECDAVATKEWLTMSPSFLIFLSVPLRNIGYNL